MHVDDLKPGMVLAADLKTPQGRFLLAGGTALTDNHLRVCKIWGVLEADVEGAQGDGAGSPAQDSPNPEALRMAKAVAVRRFAVTDKKNEVIRELARLFVVRTAKAMAAGDAAGVAGNLVPPECLLQEVKDPRGNLTPADVLKKDVQLASLPDVFHQILEALKSPRSSAGYVAEIIGKDTSLSAKLLKLVNSAFFGFPSKIDTLSRAVSIIGINQLTNLAVGISVISLFKDIPPEIMDMKSFWKHSVAVGLAARLLAAQMKRSGDEAYFVAGLLHDIGRLIMFKHYPELSMAAMSRCGANKTDLCAAETEVWGFNHALLGSRLLKQWKFPASLEKDVRYHHAPERTLPEEGPALVHVADVVVNALALGSTGGRLVPDLNVPAWEALGLSRAVLPQVVKQLDHQLDEIMRIFFHD